MTSMKSLLAGVMILCVGVGVGGYLGWTLKPSSSEGLALSALQHLADRQAEADRVAYETLQAQLEGQQQATDERAATATSERARAQQRHDAEVGRLAAEAQVALENAQELGQEAESAKADLFSSRLQVAELLADVSNPELTAAVDDERVATEAVITALTDETEQLNVVIADQAQGLRLKDALIAALQNDGFAKDSAYTALDNRFQAAEARIEQLNGRRVNFGVSVGAGAVKPLSGSWGPGTAAIVSLQLRLW